MFSTAEKRVKEWENKISSKDKRVTSENIYKNYWLCSLCSNTFINSSPDYFIIQAGRFHKPEKDCYDEGILLCSWCFNGINNSVISCEMQLCIFKYKGVLRPIESFTGVYSMPSFFNMDPTIYNYKFEANQMNWYVIIRHLSRKYNLSESKFFRYLSSFLIKDNLYVYSIDRDYYINNSDRSAITFHNSNHPKNEHINGNCGCRDCSDGIEIL